MLVQGTLFPLRGTSYLGSTWATWKTVLLKTAAFSSPEER